MKRLFGLLALLLAALAQVALVQPAFAQEYPARPDGPILDAVDLIPAAEEAALDAKLRAYNQSTGRAIIVAVVPDIGGEPVDVYARNLAEQWDIGGADTEEGVLLLIAPNQREMWISTGRGVQDRLTDISSGRIYRDILRPAFREGEFARGIDQAVDAMIERLDLSPADARAIAEADAAAQTSRESDGGFPVGTLIWLLFMFFFFVLPLLRGRSRRRKYRAKGKGPWGKRGDDDDDDRGGGLGRTARDIILWEVGSAVVRGALSDNDGWGGGGGFGGGGGGGFGGFGGGGGGFNGGGAGGGW